MPKNRDAARANLENLYRIFTVPESPDSTLGAIDQAIAADVAGFLQTHIVAIERNLEEIEAHFSSAAIPEEPTYVSEYTEFVKENLVAQSVHTAAPGFVGHMTSALPYFMLPLARLMTALNQNLVKVETSKAFTPMERQVLAMLHHLAGRYGQAEPLYRRSIAIAGRAYGPDAPCAVVARASQPEEKIIRTRLSELAACVRAEGVTRQAVVVVGRVLDTDGGETRSKLYDKDFTHGYRR